MLFIFTVIAVSKADIFEPNQEGPAPPQAPLQQPELVPRALLVSRTPIGEYNNAGVRIPTPPDNVPDVITYLTS